MKVTLLKDLSIQWYLARCAFLDLFLRNKGSLVLTTRFGSLRTRLGGQCFAFDIYFHVRLHLVFWNQERF